MLNDLFENNGSKRISKDATFLYKYIFPYFIIFVSVIMCISFIASNYLLFVPFPVIIALGLIFIVIKSPFGEIADEVYINYNRKEFVFLYKQKQIKKNFRDLTSVNQKAIGQTIELIFCESEKHLFYSRQSDFPDYSVYNEIKMILESDIGNFLETKSEI